jgi:hypothetical protein
VKKVILVLAALVLVASGVAAVSAYEAHLINVKAHVENALWVDTDEIDFGTVFPEEYLIAHRDIQLSESAINETRIGELDRVEFIIAVEWKPCEGMEGTWDEDADISNGGQWLPAPGYYNWMGYFTYVDFGSNGLAPDMNLVGDPPAGPPGTAAKQVLGGPYVATPDPQRLYVTIDVPVFEGYYNKLTDDLVMKDIDGDGDLEKPSGLTAPTWIIPADMPGFDPDGMDFGLDLKIQVSDIVRVPQ